MLSRENLHHYQIEAYDFIKSKLRCAAWLDLGLGKTATALTAIADLIDEFDIRRVLVIAPLRVASKTWPDEVQKWSHIRHLRIATAVGPQKKRIAALNDKRAHIMTINVENLVWLEEILGRNSPFDMIVVDESSMFKDRATKRFKSLVRLARSARRIVMLTGTPAPNSYVDLWSQFYILDAGERLYPAKGRFMETFFKQVDRDGHKFVLKKGAAEVIHSRVKDITVSMKSKDYLELPDRIDNIVSVDLDGDARSVYDEMENECIVELDGSEVKAVTAASVANKLMQVANGRLYGEAKTVHTLHDGKLDALREIIAEANEPVLVWYNFQSDRDAILAAFPQARALKESNAVIDEWNRGQVPILVAHPASAGHGLNLQHGGRIMVWFGLNWSLELYQQACARLHRQGQTKPVLVYHIIASDTIDETVYAVLQRKDAGQEALLAALKARLLTVAA
jgi:SNF2 family DNA or RNA helicase